MKLGTLFAGMFVAAGLCSAQVASANDYGNAKEAEAMVAKAVAYIKANGKEKAYADFTEKKKADWVDRDLYVVVQRNDGTVLAHSTNAKLVGRNLIEFKDANGKEFVKELTVLTKSKEKFWSDYQFSDPVTKKILPKSMYCERMDDTAVCTGIYKR